MEAVRRAGIDLELGGLVGRGERGLERLDTGNGNTGIGFAVETEHRRLHVARQLHRALRPQRVRRIERRAVEGAAGLQRVAMRGVFPAGAPAAAEAYDTEPPGVAALC